MKKILIGSLCVGLMLSAVVGCSKDAKAPTAEPTSAPEQESTAVVLAYEPVFEDKDFDTDWDKDTATQILLSDEGSTVEGEGAAALEGGIKISKSGEYVISGKLTDGRIIIDIENGEELKLVLNGVDIASSISAPLYALNGDVVIVLPENTENVLTDSKAYQYADNSVEEPNACLYGDDNVTIVGTGKLTVNANFNNGIGTKDELRIASASIVVHAPNNALKGNDCVLIQNADIHVESKGDGIKSDEEVLKGHGFISIMNSNVEIIAEDDGIQAISFVQAEGGQITIAAKGKRVKCDGTVNIAEGILR